VNLLFAPTGRRTVAVHTVESKRFRWPVQIEALAGASSASDQRHNVVRLEPGGGSC
jgi:hypothetical protein